MRDRSGWTLHEMLISLCVMGAILAVVSHQATSQIRLYSGIQQATQARENRMHAQAIADRILWSAAPQAGDVVVAQDSALQMLMAVGSTVTCASAPGSVTVAAGTSQRGSVLGGFSDTPEPGDRIAALFHDSIGTTWLTVRVASAPVTATCERFPATRAWQMAIAEPLTLPAGAALRVLRPIRLSLYKASDARWYLGAREWNNESNRFNTIQPVAGPYARYEPDPARSGLAFIYRDRSGQLLAPPFDAARIAGIAIVVRAASSSADTGAVSIVLRNAR